MDQSPYYERKSLSDWACQDVDILYEKISKVGSGTYGEVNKARLRSDPTKLVALKKIKDRSGTQGFPMTAMREINLLQQCDHPNVVKLLNVVTSNSPDPDSKKKKKSGSTSLVFEYMEHELLGLVQTYQFTSPQVKCIMKQILEGLHYIHSKNIIHRDIKSANILVNNQGEVKIADFGLARKIDPAFTGKYTQRVVTRWYRAPELLLGCKKYTAQIDIWALGCVFAELLMGKSHALFPAQKTPDQFAMICEKCGVPNEGGWPGHKDLPNYASMMPKKNFPRVLKQYMYKQNKNLDPLALDLLDKMLTFNPDERVTTQEALEHEYFTTSPFPCLPEEMPKFDKECHAYVLNIKRKARANINVDVSTNDIINGGGDVAKSKVVQPSQNVCKPSLTVKDPVNVISGYPPKSTFEQPNFSKQSKPQSYTESTTNNTSATFSALMNQSTTYPLSSNYINLSQMSNANPLSEISTFNSLMSLSSFSTVGMLSNLDNLRKIGSMYSTLANTYSTTTNVDTNATNINNWNNFNEMGSNINNVNVPISSFAKQNDNTARQVLTQDFSFMNDKLSMDYLNYCVLKNFSVLPLSKLETETLTANCASLLNNNITELNQAWQQAQTKPTIQPKDNTTQKPKTRSKRAKQSNTLIKIPAVILSGNDGVGTLNDLERGVPFSKVSSNTSLNCKRKGDLAIHEIDQLVKKRQPTNFLNVE